MGIYVLSLLQSLVPLRFSLLELWLINEVTSPSWKGNSSQEHENIPDGAEFKHLAVNFIQGDVYIKCNRRRMSVSMNLVITSSWILQRRDADLSDRSLLPESRLFKNFLRWQSATFIHASLFREKKVYREQNRVYRNINIQSGKSAFFLLFWWFKVHAQVFLLTSQKKHPTHWQIQVFLFFCCFVGQDSVEQPERKLSNKLLQCKWSGSNVRFPWVWFRGVHSNPTFKFYSYQNLYLFRCFEDMNIKERKASQILTFEKLKVWYEGFQGQDILTFSIVML